MSTRCSAGIQKQAEQQLQDCSDGRGDRLALSPPCAAGERDKYTRLKTHQTVNAVNLRCYVVYLVHTVLFILHICFTLPFGHFRMDDFCLKD